MNEMFCSASQCLEIVFKKRTTRSTTFGKFLYYNPVSEASMRMFVLLQFFGRLSLTMYRNVIKSR